MTHRVDHSAAMSRYYALQSKIYDRTRWAFLFGREAILEHLDLQPGETVVEIGSGTGHNIPNILGRIGDQGELYAVDCATAMLERSRRRVRVGGWKNVYVIAREYGDQPVRGGKADVVLMCYSLSMIPAWTTALSCARDELKPGGRIGVVDFCLDRETAAAKGFSSWMAFNHVVMNRPYAQQLTSIFEPLVWKPESVFGGLWSYFSFVGKRPS